MDSGFSLFDADLPMTMNEILERQAKRNVLRPAKNRLSPAKRRTFERGYQNEFD